MEKLLNIAKRLLEKNKGCLLSGSLALKLQGVNIRRDPVDIDIYVPFGKIFKIKGVDINSMDDYEGNENDDFIRDEFIFEGVKVDLFTPRYSPIPLFTVKKPDIEISVVHYGDILGFKLRHALAGNQKQIYDIIHIITNNHIR